MKNKRPKVIFFDLDHTLWDYKRNAKETMIGLHTNYLPKMSREISYSDFIKTYEGHNSRLWKAYREDKIDSKTLRKLRWHLTFTDLDVKIEKWVDEMGAEYLQTCPYKPHLMPNTISMLDQLAAEYDLHLITNGFLETQRIKIASSGLEGYFGQIFTPDSVQVKKPNPKIFAHALAEVGTLAEDAVHIGDNYEADVCGAMNAGVSPIFYNPDGKENPDSVREIKDLEELVSMFVYA
ncbi:MAG TPA: noncanonical pyrimidine nucleotidase, YjjG family [Bacteroidetes bacterium]|nr:noncanonical pyrimidine nucleotidase, YjjG family [Bacteroidota bacterium]